jgi:ABC-type branched-subunit amino acid transport system substrate-binding protein
MNNTHKITLIIICGVLFTVTILSRQNQQPNIVENQTILEKEHNVIRIAVTYEKLAENVEVIPNPVNEENVIALINYTEAEINQYCIENQFKTKFKLIPTPVIHKGGTQAGENPPGLDEMIQLNKTGINLIVGHDYSLANRYSFEYANENNMLLLSPTGVGVGQSIPDDNLFKLSPNSYEDPEVYHRVFAKLIKILGIEAFITINTGNYSVYNNLIKETAKALNYSYKPSRVYIDVNSPYIEPYLEQAEEYVIKAIENYGANKVCILVEPLWMNNFEFLRAAKKYPVLSEVPWFDIIGVSQDNATQHGYDSFLTEYGFIRLIKSTSRSAKADVFWRSYIESIGKAPIPSKRYGEAARYDAMWIMAKAVIQANSSNTDEVKRMLPQVCKTYPGVLGNCTLNEFGDRNSTDYDIYRWVMQDYEPVFKNIGHYDSETNYFNLDENYLEIPQQTIQDNPLDENTVKNIFFSDIKILYQKVKTNNLKFNVNGVKHVRLWFQIKKEAGEGTRYSAPLPVIDLENNQTVMIYFIDETSPIWENYALPVSIKNTIYLLDPWRERLDGSSYPTIEGWKFAFTPQYDSWTNALVGNVTMLSNKTYIDFDIHPSPIKETPITFDASNCYSPEGIKKYSWRINKEELRGVKVQYSFKNVGNYTARLTITDNTGNTFSLKKSFYVELENPFPLKSPESKWITYFEDCITIDDMYAILGNVYQNQGDPNDSDYDAAIKFYNKDNVKYAPRRQQTSNITLEGEEWMHSQRFARTSDSGFIIAGYIEDQNIPIIAKYSSEGVKEWSRVFNQTRYYNAEKILPMGNGSYLLLSSFLELNAPSSSAHNWQTALYVLNEDGNVTLLHGFSGSLYDLKATSDNGYILVGRGMQVLKLDSDLGVEWDQQFGSSSNSWASSVLELDDGYIMSVTFNQQEGKIGVLKIDETGNKLWNRTYGGYEGDSLKDIIETGQGFILTGQKYSSDDDSFDIWVLWIDKSGDIVKERAYSRSSGVYESGYRILNEFKQIVVIASYRGKHSNLPWLILIQ